MTTDAPGSREVRSRVSRTTCLDNRTHLPVTQNTISFMFFEKRIYPHECDEVLWHILEREIRRQEENLSLIASENYASRSIMQLQGSCLTNKYAEGYPGRRYYGGCENADLIEELAVERAKLLFGADYANVQPHSGTQANDAVYLALLKPGDVILGMELDHGGHLSHGSTSSSSGKVYRSVSYRTDGQGSIDYGHLREMAELHRPRLIVGGFSSYSGPIDWAELRRVADEVGSYLLADISHVAGLVIAGIYPDPLPHADLVTTTTHKTLAGPRGGLIVARGGDEKMYSRIDSAVFPGVQGGPLLHVIAAKAFAFLEARRPEFTRYQRRTVRNAQIMAKTFLSRGFQVISGGTTNHLLVLNLLSRKMSGLAAERLLEHANIVVNRNMIPGDPAGPSVTSGIRIGTPAVTRRGLGEEEMIDLANWMCDLMTEPEPRSNVLSVREKVLEICRRFPVYVDRSSRGEDVILPARDHLPDRKAEESCRMSVHQDRRE